MDVIPCVLPITWQFDVVCQRTDQGQTTPSHMSEHMQILLTAQCLWYNDDGVIMLPLIVVSRKSVALLVTSQELKMTFYLINTLKKNNYKKILDPEDDPIVNIL